MSAVTASNYQEFWRCGSCRRVYWEGKSFQMAVQHYRQFARASAAPEESPRAGPRAALE